MNTSLLLLQMMLSAWHGEESYISICIHIHYRHLSGYQTTDPCIYFTTTLTSSPLH